jgi:VWFA-related protein
VDDRGVPVPDLGADRFDITVDGRKRKVIRAEYVERRAPRADSTIAADHFTSNEHVQQDGRLVLIAVDQAHVRRVEGAPALRAAAEFIDALDRRDRVAATTLDSSAPLEFTYEHPTVKRRLQQLTGSAAALPLPFNIGLSEALAISEGGRARLDMVVRRECGESLVRSENPRRRIETEEMRDPCPVQLEQAGRALAQEARADTRASLDSLRRLIDRLADIEGPKTLVLVSEGFAAEPQLFDMTSLGAAAQAARVTMYALQLETSIFEASDAAVSPTFTADIQLRADGLSRLAGTARGALFRLVGADPYPFKRILSETSAYYLLGFEAAEDDRDGRSHRIAVSVRGAGATVRSRPTFAISPKAAATVDSEIVRLLRTTRLAAELPLRVSVYAFRDIQRERLKLLLTAETDIGTTDDPRTVGVVLIDASGVIVASDSGRTESGRYSVQVTVRAGLYRLRGAAVDRSGRHGSVERQFEARLAADSDVEFSDLVLAEPSAPGPGGRGRPIVTVMRGDRGLAYLEAYTMDNTPPTGSVRIDLVPEGQRAPVSSTTAVVARTGVGRWLISAELSLRDLPPGEYTAIANIALGGSARTLVRAFRKDP